MIDVEACLQIGTDVLCLFTRRILALTSDCLGPFSRTVTWHLQKRKKKKYDNGGSAQGTLPPLETSDQFGMTESNVAFPRRT
jgi:hypothetical protein